MKEGGGGPGAGGMQDIFDMFTGGGGRRQTRERRGENVVHRLKVSLEEVYNGGTRCALFSKSSCGTGCVSLQYTLHEQHSDWCCKG